MKIRKSVLIMLLYDALKAKAVKMEEFTKEYKISIPTFKRYITDIREYLCFRNRREELIYDKSNNSYSITTSA